MQLARSAFTERAGWRRPLFLGVCDFPNRVVMVSEVLTAGGAYMASCAMCAGLGATIPGAFGSSPLQMHNLALYPAKMPGSL